ncbi:MAG TPA: CHAT domain-containing protein [Pyrinomonadaceae bacterium]|nr:CHAT domain-containing protein [Pyrinomonadaceae bacterium]
MRCVKSFIAGLLLISSALGGVPSRAVESPLKLMKAAAAEVEQSSDAASEREQGRSLLHRGKAADALVHLERALKAFQAAGDKAGEASTRDLMGELYERQGRYDIALQNYNAAYDNYSALAASESKQGALAASLSTQEGTYNANLMLAKIGQMQYRRGDAAAARAAFSRMRVTKPDTDKLKNAQNTKSNTESGAKKIFGIGSRIRGATSGTPSTSTPGAVTGVVTDTADTLKQPFNSYRETVIYATYELGMGRVDYLNDRLDDAKTHFNNVLAATGSSLSFVGKLGQTRRYRTAARTSLGDVAFRQGRYADAAKLYADAAKGARDDNRLDLMWPAERGAGRSLWYQAAGEKDQKKAAKMREDALSSYRQALDTIEAQREGSLRADEARATFLATTADVFDEAAGALAEMALAAQSNSVPGASVAPATSAPLDGRALAYASEALGVVERGRSRSLLDLLNEADAEITEGVPADLLQKKRDNQNRQQEIAAQLTGLNLGEKPTKSVEQLEAELNQLQNDYDDIENQIRSASPRYAALTASKPLALEDIRREVLDDQTALLEYKLGEEHSYLFAVTREGFTLSRLPSRAEIEKQAIALREQIIPASARRSITEMVSATPDAQRGLTLGGNTAGSPAAVTAFAQVSNALYKSCVEPAAPLFKDDRLLVVADGALSYIPFHALVTAAPAAAADFSTLPYLLKTNDSLFAPSASVVAAIRQQRAASTQGNGMLVVADPVFDSSDARARGAKTAAAQASDGNAARGLSFDSALADVSDSEPGKASTGAGPQRGVLVRLSGTRTEAQQIARLANTSGQKADVWLDLDANESNVEDRDLRQYRVLHFATHGLLNTERPQFTGVVLSLVGNKPGTDGFLRTDEVFNLRLGSPLVMLSACETGLGKEKRGEGVMGLARAFMYAGAPTVGVSLWSVADKSTADLMTDFYKNLLAGPGKSPTAAMRTARLDMINGKRYSAPFYWAPFVLVGDWK